MYYIKTQQEKFKIFKIFIGKESISKIVYTESGDHHLLVEIYKFQVFRGKI